MTMFQLPYHIKPVNGLSPVNVNGLAIGGDRNFVNMENYQSVDILIMCGAMSSTPAITLQQAKNVEGNGAKAVAIAEVWQNVVGSSPAPESDQWRRVTVTSDTFDLAANTNYIIHVRGSMLDVTNKFNAIRLAIAAEAGTNLVSAIYLCHQARYKGEGADMPTTAVN